MADMGRRQSYWQSSSNCKPSALCLLWGILASLASSSLTAAALVSSLATPDKFAKRIDLKNDAGAGQSDSSGLGPTQMESLRQIFPEGTISENGNYTMHHGNPPLGRQSRATMERNMRVSESNPPALKQATKPSTSEHQAPNAKPDKPSSTRQLGWDTFFAFMKEQPEENSRTFKKKDPVTQQGEEFSLKTSARDYANNTVDSVGVWLTYDTPSTQRVNESSANESSTYSRVAARQSQSDIAGKSTGTGSKGPAVANMGSFVAGQEGHVHTTSSIVDADKLGGERGFREETTEADSRDRVNRAAKRQPQGDGQMSLPRSANLPVTSVLTTAMNSGSDRGAGWKGQADESGEANLVSANKDSAPTAVLENIILDTLSNSISADAGGGVTDANQLPAQRLRYAGLDRIFVNGAATAELPGKATAGQKRTEGIQAGVPMFGASTHLSASLSAKAEELRSASGRGGGTTGEDTATFEPSSPPQTAEVRHQHREDDSTRLSRREKEQLVSPSEETEASGVPHVKFGTLAEQERFLRLLLSAVQTVDNTYGMMPATEDSLSASHVLPSPLSVKNTNLLNFNGEGGGSPLDRTQAERGTAFWTTTYHPDVRGIARTAMSSRELEKIQETRGVTEDVAETIWNSPQTSKESAISTEPESDTGKTTNKQVTDSASFSEKTEEKLHITGAEKGKGSGKVSPIPHKKAESRHLSNLTASRATHQKKPTPGVRFQEGNAAAFVEEKGDTLRESHSTEVAMQQLIGRPSASTGNIQQDQQITRVDIQEKLTDQSGSKGPYEELQGVDRLTQVSLPKEVKIKDSALQTQEATLKHLLLERRRLLFAISELIGNVGAGLVPFTAFLDKEDPADQSAFFEITRTYPEVIRALLLFRHPSWPTATSIKRIHQEVKYCAVTAENIWRTVKALRVGTGDSTRKGDICASFLTQKLEIAEKSARTAQLFARVFFSLYQLACYYVTEKKFKDAADEANTMRLVFPEIHSHLMDALLPGALNSEKVHHDTMVDMCPFHQHMNTTLIKKEITLQRQLVGHLDHLAEQLEVASRFEAALHKLTTLLDKRPRIVKPSPPDLTATKTRCRGRKRTAALRQGRSQ